MNIQQRTHSNERDVEVADALLDRLEQLVQAGRGLRHALPISGKGLAELRGWLASMGRTDIWESLQMNTIGNQP